MARKTLVCERVPGPKALEIESPAFGAGKPIPTKYTVDGDNVSPPLVWHKVPIETKMLVLIVEDPDAPRTDPCVHWVAYDIPGETRKLAEAVPANGRPGRPESMRQGPNFAGDPGWMGPAPPHGHGTHHYHFELFALDDEMRLPDGATREELARAMKGHVLASGELVGTYAR
jgi:Raf kinase inhibitor-like YbhB/YbcL family protein